MVNFLPAILLGGPPHAGKSVLFYSLSRALRQRGISHHAIRACPDGEGNWSQEMEQDTVSTIRVKGQWTPEFVQRVCHDIEHRCLPLLVDIGGRPTEAQTRILRACTHSLLLLKSGEPELSSYWSQLVTSYGLLPLAILASELAGPSEITSNLPTLEGTISGLQRGETAQGPVFDAALARIETLFTAYSPVDLKKSQLGQAPTELAIDVEVLRQTYYAQSNAWDATFLPSLLASLPGQVPLSVYGPGPQWLYAALAVHAGPAAFYQFDPRLGDRSGWVEPLPLKISDETSSEIEVKQVTYPEMTLLSLRLKHKHLEYAQLEPLPFPPVRLDAGLILDGSLPSWLVTALVRLYQQAGVAWIACHQPQSKGAIIVSSRTPTHLPGQLVVFP